MSDQYVPPEPAAPRAWGNAQQAAPQQPVPQQQWAVPPPVAPQAQVTQAQHAWVDGYEPGNPWQARLCMQSSLGTLTFPLTPHTMPELLEQLVLVAQEQQGLPVGFSDTEAPGQAGTHDEADGDEQERADAPGGKKSSAASRLSGWAVVHELWERDNPTVRIAMGAIVVVLLLLGVFIA
ncbi:hypothetical protein [Streptomyces sp. H27-C3]|uniref:hypothetical protein n=1 Tax=Streptomyces sp. H27-C3 TaxID=3046305 RepID=UPI0024BB4FC1|nr:hypothetical protein [Streptomyces sp. H27-C3]MDJ0464301.1 hypothetical protein [Streptomyces sp. H27-C3]